MKYLLLSIMLIGTGIFSYAADHQGIDLIGSVKYEVYVPIVYAERSVPVALDVLQTNDLREHLEIQLTSCQIYGDFKISDEYPDRAFLSLRTLICRERDQIVYQYEFPPKDQEGFSFIDSIMGILGRIVNLTDEIEDRALVIDPETLVYAHCDCFEKKSG